MSALHSVRQAVLPERALRGRKQPVEVQHALLSPHREVSHCGNHARSNIVAVGPEESELRRAGVAGAVQSTDTRQSAEKGLAHEIVPHGVAPRGTAEEALLHLEMQPGGCGPGIRKEAQRVRGRLRGELRNGSYKPSPELLGPIACKKNVELAPQDMTHLHL